jgi:transcriptional regulator with XRE-family HTH domain
MELTPEKLAQIKREKQDYVRGRLRRQREHAELSQADVAKKLGISQQAVGKWERDGTAPEDVLRKLWRLYGLHDDTPSAPKDPQKRVEWMGRRNQIIRGYRPTTKTIGATK